MMGAESVRSNSKVFIDIMYLDREPVPHLVDDVTRFSAARFLRNVPLETIWETILMFWATVDTGLPHKLLVDQGSQFQKRFVELA